MNEDFNKCLEELQQELCNAKSNLNLLNDSIRRVVGRPMGTDDISHNGDSGVCARYSSVQRQKHGKSMFNRLSHPRDESKLRLSSRVIRDLPTRQEVLEAQGSDLESRARNRRMFGSLLGTLHKFCQEESRLKQREEKKAKIEKKLEEQQFLEREMLRKERDLLLLNQKKKQITIKNLELKINRLKDFTVLDRSKTEKLMSNTSDALNTEIRNRKLALTDELKVIDMENKISTESIKEQEKEDMLFQKDHSVVRQNGIRKETETKENKSRNLIESALGSSIVVVTKS